MKPEQTQARSSRSKETGIALLLLLGLIIVLFCVLFSGSASEKDKSVVETLQEKHIEGDQPDAEIPPSESTPSTSDDQPDAEIPPSESTLSTSDDQVPSGSSSDQEEQVSVPDEAQNQQLSQKEHFLVVHSFAVKSNAVNFADKLEKHGYQVKSAVRKNGWTAVGVLFDPEDVDEQGLLQALEAEYKAKPVLWDDLDSAN